jgi:hypothetical protein
MATVNGYSAARMQQIEDETVVDGHVSGDSLILERRDGTVINAGVVQGPQGDPALPTNLGSNGGVYSNAVTYVRVATVDGLNDTNGAQVIFDFIGGSNFGETNLYSAKVHVSQRGADTIKVEVFDNGILNAKIEWYTRKLSTYVFEVWVKLPLFAGAVQLQPLVQWHGSVTYNGQTSSTPSNLVSIGTISDNTQFAKALLDPTYRGPGPARVSFLPGGSLSTEYYQWEGKYENWGNRVVNLRRVGSTWVITGHNSEEGYGGKINLAPTLANGWLPYTLRNQDVSDRWAWPRAQKLVSGIVVLSGLIGYGSTAAAGTLLATLPAGYRPDTGMVYAVNNGDTAKTISINALGEIRVEGGTMSASTYISLDGIAFPAAGVATWTNIGDAGSGSAFANGWTAYNTGLWGAPRYWKDPYGFVWFAGILGGGSTASDNLPMVTLPTTHQQFLQSHVKAANNGVFGFVSALPGSGQGISWKNGSLGGNTWISLCNVINVTTEAVANNPWYYPGLLNGWNRYSTLFPQPAYLRRGDGIGMSMGLMAGGTAPPVKIAGMPNYLLPDAGIILYGVSSAGFNRQDFVGFRVIEDAIPPGSIRMQSGSATWNSWDSHVWMVGD